MRDLDLLEGMLDGRARSPVRHLRHTEGDSERRGARGSLRCLRPPHRRTFVTTINGHGLSKPQMKLE